MRTAHRMGQPQATIRSIHSCRESKGKESGQVKDQSIYRTRHMERGSALLDPTHAEVPTAALPARTPILSTRLKPQFPRQAGRRPRLPRGAAVDDHPAAWSDESLVYKVFICSCKIIFNPTS